MTGIQIGALSPFRFVQQRRLEEIGARVGTSRSAVSAMSALHAKLVATEPGTGGGPLKSRRRPLGCGRRKVTDAVCYR